MVGLGKLFGTVLMCCRCTRKLGRGGLVLAGNSGMGTVWEVRVLGFGRNGPSDDSSGDSLSDSSSDTSSDSHSDTSSDSSS
nr:hypothetical protein [Tanacetum cinerariifolium]